MSEKTKELIKLIDILPEKEQDLISEMVKRVVLAWDPDFIKVTPAEAERIRLAEDEFLRGEVFSESDINWE